jgi:predicted lactoylglutathione lyase
MQLGNFSVSLAVKDLIASREFYEKLGFRVVGGNGRKALRSDQANMARIGCPPWVIDVGRPS